MDSNKLVWAKLRNHPWWPGRLMPEEETTRKLVQFFDEERAEERVAVQNIKDYVEHRDELHTAGLRQCRTSAIKETFEAAIVEADEILRSQEVQVQMNKRSRTSTGRCSTRKATPNGVDLPVADKSVPSAEVQPNPPSTGDTPTRYPRRSDRNPRLSSSEDAELIKERAKSIPIDLLESKQPSTEKTKGRRRTKSNILNKSQSSDNHKESHLYVSNSANGSSVKKRSASHLERLPLTENFKSPNSDSNIVTHSPSSSPFHKHQKKQLILPAIVPSHNSPKVITKTPLSSNSSLSHSKVKATRHKCSHISNKKSPSAVNGADSEKEESSSAATSNAGMSAPGAANVEQTDTKSMMEDMHSGPTAQSSQVEQLKTVESSDDDDDDELPSLEQAFQQASSSDLCVGSLVWVKLRKYPQWPGVICKMNEKKNKAAIKFINAENLTNGLWVNKTTLTDFPGNLFREYEQQGINHHVYASAILKAVKLVNCYLHDKCTDESLDPFTYFFPNHDKLVELESLVSDDDSGEGSENSVLSVGSSIDSPPFRPHKFGEETRRVIREREEWLVSLVKTIEEDPIIKKKLISYIKTKGKRLEPLVARHSFLGPFTYSNSHQGVKLLNYIVSAYNCVEKSIHLPDWCYTCVIPQVIICGIQKLDGLTFEKAKEKYFMDLATEEEDSHLHEQIINSSRKLSEDEELHYQTVFGVSTP